MANPRLKREASRRHKVRTEAKVLGKDPESYCLDKYKVGIDVFVTDEHHSYVEKVHAPTERHEPKRSVSQSSIDPSTLKLKKGPLPVAGDIREFVHRNDKLPLLVKVVSVKDDVAMTENIEPDRPDKSFPHGWSSGANFTRGVVEEVRIRDLRVSERTEALAS